MIEHDSSKAISDGAIRRFLLGKLTVPEQAAFENRFVADDELGPRVRLSELRLADDYAQHRLNREDSLRVRERFLVTRDRQYMAAVSQALHARFTPATQRNIQGFFSFNHAAWRYAFAATILIILFATVWLGVKERRLAIKLPLPKRVQPKALPMQSPVVAHHPTSPSMPTHSENISPLPDHERALSMTLSMNNTVESPYELKFPYGGTSIRAVVNLEKNQLGSYRAQVWNSHGESAFSADGLIPNDEGKLVVDVPALDLSTGEYMIRLQSTEEAAGLQFYFRIVR